MLNLTIHNLDDVTVFHCAGRITAEDKGKLQRAVLSQQRPFEQCKGDCERAR